MTIAVSVGPLDLGDDAELAAAYAVESAATSHVRAGWTPLGESARLAAWRADNGWHRHLVGSTSAAVDELVEGFARRLGYQVATTETVVELDLVHADLPADATGHSTAYALSTHVDGVPYELRAQVGVLKGLVDAQAPNGELDWQPTPVSVEEYAGEIALAQEQGRTTIESVALDADGAVVAWTGLVVAATPARPAQIEGTLVLTEHRGHGLGRAVKLASLRAAREHGRTSRVRTSSDDGNVWMRRINADLGFVPVESEVIVHRRR